MSLQVVFCVSSSADIFSMDIKPETVLYIHSFCTATSFFTFYENKIAIRKVANFYKLYGNAKFEGHIANVTPTFHIQTSHFNKVGPSPQCLNSCSGPRFFEITLRHTHLVGLLLTSHWPVAENCTSQLPTLTRDRPTCPQQDLNPQSQQTSGHRTTSQTVWPLGLLP